MTRDTPPGLPDDLALETVDLTVADIGRARAFYERVIGLEALPAPVTAVSDRTSGTGRAAEPELVLGRGGRPIVRLGRAPSPAAPPAASTGLFHLAVLLPSRADLADFVAALVASRAPVVGVADHGVSEAIYLQDPDGHGVEVYADRPRDVWPRREGRIAMTTDPLDVDGLLADAARSAGRAGGQAGGQADAQADAQAGGWDAARPWSAPAGTRLGHVHLRVRDVDEALAFYRDVVGFDEVASLPGAAFLSVGGYHHHLGVNAWQSAGSSPPDAAAPRLQRVRASVGSRDALVALQFRLGLATPQREESRAAAFSDPSGVAWRIFVRDRS